MKTTKLLAVSATAVLALAAAACGSDDSSPSGGASGGGTINGAGATFPQPIYSEWAARFKAQKGTTVNYQGIGSGGGIAQFTAATVDFGASDAAMTDEELQAAEKKGRPVHVPTVLGAVTISYNVHGVGKGLRLDGTTAADIFLGKITRWDDAAIKALNPGLNLPGTAITVCHRSDESGTTKNFLQFLADYSPAWANGPGVDKSVKWPTGTGAKGNDGVAGCIKQSDGAIGYVEQAYALQNDFTYAAVKNKAGRFVTPTLAATSAAAEGTRPPRDLRFSTIDGPGAKTYPISAITFLLVYQDMCKAGMAKPAAQRTTAWLSWDLNKGQQIAPQLQYAPLPASIKTMARAKVHGLRCNGAPLKG